MTDQGTQMADTKEASMRALKLYESMERLDCWEKRDAVAVLNTLVELDVRRSVEKPPLQRNSANS